MPFDATPELTLNEALEIIGGLSNPSKMPWYGWSTDAKACHTGSKLRQTKGTICSKCYAHKGFYVFKNVRSAMSRRLEALKDPRFVEAFIFALNELYRRSKKKENRFRWHDSGDLQGVEHLEMIVEIAKGTPQIEHYLPTKEPGYVAQFLKGGGEFPSNLHVKISNPMIGQAFEKAPMGLSHTSVGVDDDPRMFQCPALKKQGNKCLDCRMCWTGANINYPIH